MLIPTIFNTFPECIPEKGILHIGAHMCEERALYNTINIGIMTHYGLKLLVKLSDM